MSKKKRLGRGLEALLGVGKPPAADSPQDSQNQQNPQSESATDPSASEPTVAGSTSNLDASASRPADVPAPAAPDARGDSTSARSAQPPVTSATASTDEDSSSPTILKFPGASTSATSAAGRETSSPAAGETQSGSASAESNSPAGSSVTSPRTSPTFGSSTSLVDPARSTTSPSSLRSEQSPGKGRDETGLDKNMEKSDEPVLDVRTLKPQPPTSSQSASSRPPAAGEGSSELLELNVYDVDDNPFQPRREFNKSEIESLAESLKTHEQLQPILVRRVAGRYQLISGERRLRAAIHAGWSKIRAQVREADDRLVAELAIVENLQRKDLNPIEKALSFRRYLDQHGCTQEDLAGRLKIDRSTVTNLLRLLELPEVVQKAVQLGIISNGHARALLPLGEEHLQIEFCNRIQREGLSVRAVEQLVRDRIDEEDGVKRKPAGKSRTRSAQIVSLESELRNALGTKVEIKPTSRGRGKIVVHYLSREEFDRLRELLGEAADSSGSSGRGAA